MEDKSHLVDTIVESPAEGKKKFTKSTAVVQEVECLEKNLEDMKEKAAAMKENHPELADEVDEAITATETQLAEAKQKAKDLVDKLFEEEKGSIFLSVSPLIVLLSLKLNEGMKLRSLPSSLPRGVSKRLLIKSVICRRFIL